MAVESLVPAVRGDTWGVGSKIPTIRPLDRSSKQNSNILKYDSLTLAPFPPSTPPPEPRC
jgi:hypothetical protein